MRIIFPSSLFPLPLVLCWTMLAARVGAAAAARRAAVGAGRARVASYVAFQAGVHTQRTGGGLGVTVQAPEKLERELSCEDSLEGLPAQAIEGFVGTPAYLLEGRKARIYKPSPNPCQDGNGEINRMWVMTFDQNNTRQVRPLVVPTISRPSPVALQANPSVSCTLLCALCCSISECFADSFLDALFVCSVPLLRVFSA
jgi:hypothetical protein